MVKVRVLSCPRCGSPVSINSGVQICGYCGISLVLEDSDGHLILRSFYVSNVVPGKMQVPLILKMVEIINKNKWSEEIVCMSYLETYDWELSLGSDGVVTVNHFVEARHGRFAVCKVVRYDEGSGEKVPSFFERLFESYVTSQPIKKVKPKVILDARFFNVFSDTVYLGERAVILVSDAKYQGIAEAIAKKVGEVLGYTPDVELAQI